MIPKNHIGTDPHDLTTMKEEMRFELMRILTFWSKEVYNEKDKRFVGRIDHFGNKEAKASLGAVLISRILWTFSAAHCFYNRPGVDPNREEADLADKCREIAESAFSLLRDVFWDQENGGLVWSVGADGEVLQGKKQAYAQGFGIYGLSEYYRAFRSEEALKLAWELHDLLESRLIDKEFDGYWEALDADWKPLEDLRLSDKDKNYPKSMNTHLHILEPYANLYRVDPGKELGFELKSILELFLTKIIDQKSGHFDLFFEKDWTPVPSGVSYGHDIEGAWLMREAALLLEDEQLLKQVETASLRLVDITLAEGTDADGSLFNERNGDHLDSDKHWWPQAEAMVGLMDATQIKGNENYVPQIHKVWNFIKSRMMDLENGEWFWRVDKSGKPIETEDKAGFWKCPYHNSRALMEMIERIDTFV